MAGRVKYVVAHPDGEDHIEVLKGGKRPTFATWAYYTEEHPHPTEGAGWVHMGYSFQATLEEAQKKALPDFRKHGMEVTATQIIPTRPLPKR